MRPIGFKMEQHHQPNSLLTESHLLPGNMVACTNNMDAMFQRLNKQTLQGTGKHVTPHMFRHYLPFLTMSC
jgi:hypothetical protein